MAAIIETSRWEEEVRQVSIGDPVAGGDAGPVNLSLQDLANRTLYLRNILDAAKQELETISGQVGNLSLSDALLKNKNLSDVASKATARNNIYAAAADHMHDDVYLKMARNLEDIDDTDAARLTLGAAALDHVHDCVYISRKDLIGEIIMWPLPVPPKYFLEFNGATLKIAEYPDLFAVVGTRWGGDGKTTFKLFDARGGLPRAWDNGRGVDPGRAIGTWQEDALKEHRHKGGIINDHLRVFVYGGTEEGVPGLGTQNNCLMDQRETPRYQQWTSFDGDDETRPKNFSIMFCIRYA